MRRGSLAITLAAAAFAATLAAGCERPPDEAWLQFLGFHDAATAENIAVLQGELRNGETDSADALFRNTSLTVGVDGAGSGVLVYRARVEYSMADLQPPANEYALNLYLPAPSHTSGSSGTTTDVTGTITGFPLAPASLKSWIIGTGAATRPTVNLTARATFFARTDDGSELESPGSISIALSNK